MSCVVALSFIISVTARGTTCEKEFNECREAIIAADEAIDAQERTIWKQEQLLDIREKRIKDLEESNKRLVKKQLGDKIEHVTTTSIFWLLVFLL